MEKERILEIVISCARQRLHNSSMEGVADEIGINGACSFDRYLAFDSLDYAEMALDLEHRFAQFFLKVSSEKLQELNIIDNVVLYVSSKITS